MKGTRELVQIAAKFGLQFLREDSKSKHRFVWFRNKDGAEWAKIHHGNNCALTGRERDIAMNNFRKFSAGQYETLRGCRIPAKAACGG